MAKNRSHNDRDGAPSEKRLAPPQLQARVGGGESPVAEDKDPLSYNDCFTENKNTQAKNAQAQVQEYGGLR